MSSIETDLGTILEKLDARLERLEQKIDSNQSRTEEKLSAIDNRISKLEGMVQGQQPYIQKIPDMAEKIGELKNWKQVALTVGGAFVGTVITYIVKNPNS